MHAVSRQYNGGAELARVVQEHRGEVEQLMKTVPGFISWVLAKSGDTYTTYTVCQDQAGCQRSIELAREFVGKHASSIQPPQVTEFQIIERIVK